jgi:O-antigen/teichoic acid export membrane protein
MLVSEVFRTSQRAISYFSYTPLLFLSAALSFVRVIIYARSLDSDQFGILSQMLIVSNVFGMAGSLGTQLVAHRDVPKLLQAGSKSLASILLFQCIVITTATMCFCLVAGLLGARPFSLTATGFSVAIVHGWSQQIFATALIEQKSRLAMMSYAGEMARRSALMAVAGLCAVWWLHDAEYVLLAEFGITVIVFPKLLRALCDVADLPIGKVSQRAIQSLSEMAWRAAIVLFGGTVVSFASINLDRWIAAEWLARAVFGQYSFVWIVVMASQLAQNLLNVGFFPLLARRRVERGELDTLKLSAGLSVSLLAIGSVGGLLAGFALRSMIPTWFPQYSGAEVLVPLLIIAAVFRFADFWSSFLIITNREGPLLQVQGGLLLFVLVIWFGLFWYLQLSVSASLLCWLAVATAVASYVGSCAYALYVGLR